ncbi:MAG TPA: hypothetical protein DCK98_11895 [Chloroflexi bacterium]|nr:hypothetical protein [Chloroflexota bacterium]
MTDTPFDADPLYVAARRVLLDALTALSPHGRAVIVAGAQAIYLRTDTADLSVAPYTTDADLALDPSLLGDNPELETAMTGAGFHLSAQDGGNVDPGVWVAQANVEGTNRLIPVDLIVPEGVAPAGGRRAARLGAHGNRAARRAVGLEAALVDHGPMTITALDPGDERSIEAEVAGSAGLIIAKLHKIHDRVESGRTDRVDDKDAADVVRIMQTTRAVDVGATIAALCHDDVAGAVSMVAVEYLDALFGRRGRPGIEMAARALRLAMPEDRVEVVSTAYVSAVLAEVREQT